MDFPSMRCSKCGKTLCYCSCPQKCSKCGQPTYYCKCYSIYKQKEDSFDVSFQCYTCKLYFDKDNGTLKNNEEKEHDHTKCSTFMTTLWEEVVYIMCQNLITLMKYRDAIESKANEITCNETFHDYILTRLENIENCWCSLFLNGKIDVEEYKDFSCEHEMFLSLLNEDNKDKDGQVSWRNLGYFNNYIDWIKNSPLFKNNDIKIL